MRWLIISPDRVLFGANDPLLMVRAINLSMILRLLGDLQEVREIVRSVLNRFRILLGEKHPPPLLCAINLAV